MLDRRGGSQFVGSPKLRKDPEGNDAALLNLLLVEPEERGRRVERNLLRLSIDFARKARYKHVMLRTDHGHEVARGLYRRQGFKVIDEFKLEFDFEFLGEVWELVLY